jgi:hypothetical protein
MECDGFEGQVLDLLYGELPAERRAAVEAHASSCEACGALSRELGEARKAASVLTVRETPPAELDERVKLMARAAAPVDVRRQSVRGGGLHVAAVVFLGLGLVASSFAVGVRYGKPGGIEVPNPNDGKVVEPLPNPNLVKHTPLIRHVEPRNDEDIRLYREAVPDLARSLEKKGDWDQALRIWGWVYSSGAERGERSISLLEARLGMARAYKQKGEIEKARDAAREVKECNDDWGFKQDELENEASDLIKALNQKLR